MSKILKYISQLLAGQNGTPSAKRHASMVFGLSAVIMGFMHYEPELVGIFTLAALGENITTLFERGKK
jgi:hypothetical protein